MDCLYYTMSELPKEERKGLEESDVVGDSEETVFWTQRGSYTY